MRQRNFEMLNVFSFFEKNLYKNKSKLMFAVIGSDNYDVS